MGLTRGSRAALFFGLFYVTLVACLVLAAGCGLCENEVLWEVRSPDNAKKAVAFIRSCGATTPNGTNVSILEGSQRLPNAQGNAFVADGNHGQSKLGPRGEISVRLRWVRPDEVVLDYPSHARVFRSESGATGVRLRYSQYEDDLN